MSGVTRIGGALLLLTAVTLTGAGVTAPDPAAAQSSGFCGNGCNSDGGKSAQGYSAAAAYASLHHSGGTSTPQPCSFAGRPEDAAHPGAPGHVEVHSYGPFYGPDGHGQESYDVFIDCVQNGFTDITGPGSSWYVIEYYTVTPLPPRDLVEQALAHLNVAAPQVHTSPGDGKASLVGIRTYLTVDNASWGPAAVVDTEGPLSVRVWATPKDGGEVTWDTGEGRVVCHGNGQPAGSCSYTYQRSSFGQGGRDDRGRPSYQVTASITYTGGYEVFVYGQAVGGNNLGDIVRTSQPLMLPVAEAQALNTDGNGRTG